jgi:aminoglycoside phosphotransferase (APT) family kinase protein
MPETRPFETPEPEWLEFLIATGLARRGEESRWIPLTGGVSSDIWRVDLPGRSLCVKRALADLKVAADWQAPVSRNAYEWAWLCFASQCEPASVPRPLAHDEQAGLFAMEFLDPAEYPVWKSQLMRAEVHVNTAAAVGALLGRLHAASAFDPALAAAFDTSDIFYALRMDAYLLETGRRNPGLEAPLRNLADKTLSRRIALVHGDVSPKNILVGPRGPIIVDAETAWFGDPAFDVAFCLNHLLLKCLVWPRSVDDYLACFEAFTHAYMEQVDWEAPAGLEARVAALLPALMLARVDGKSPVEYLTGETQKNLVRKAAAPLVAEPVQALAEVAARWRLVFDA